MDQTIFDTYHEDSHFADWKRMDSFRFGGAIPPPKSDQATRKPSHARSHSRKTSVSAPTTSSISSSSSSSLSTSGTPPTTPTRSSVGASKRNSHHRRRSSVSTRHESAEMMGVSLPFLPQSVADDNINLGDKDSIRRRALWTLEGRADVGSFSKVAIPEFGTQPEVKPFEFPSKPSYPPGIGAGYGGLNTLGANKRDSFNKLMPPSTAKEQLHTLVEEEEEEDEADGDNTVVSSPIEVPDVRGVAQAPPRHRPASLILKPLSMGVSPVNASPMGDLPTPCSPVPPPRPGLRSLTLMATPSPEVSQEKQRDLGFAQRRHSLILTPSPSPPVLRRPSLNIPADVPLPPIAVAASRRSSISYVNSPESGVSMNHGLPTPEMTPTVERRISMSSNDSGSSRGSRPLSVTEQHFLFQAHQTLVQRITDLERALANRPRSRPQSCVSDVSAASEPPSDEMLQLIADLKTERDELKKDCDGWRTRLTDTEKQMGLLFGRVETERREAWVARERAGLLEIEKRSLERAITEKLSWGEEGWNKYRAIEVELAASREECAGLQPEVLRAAELEAECNILKTQLAEANARREELERELEGLLATPTPGTFSFSKPASNGPSRLASSKRGGLGFHSVDSISSATTDVEPSDGCFDKHQLSLNSVEEEEENDSNTECSDDANELAGYEEEGEDDEYAFQESSSSSSLGSIDEFHSNAHRLGSPSATVPPLSPHRSPSVSPSPLPTPEPAHNRHASLSKGWTFPQNRQHTIASLPHEADEVDHFFGCLEDVDNSPPIGGKLRSVESDKNLFHKALADADDDFPPFMIPADVGFEVADSSLSSCGSVLEDIIEEDEVPEAEVSVDTNDEFVGQEDEGGIIFTFNPPPNFGDDSFDDSAEASTLAESKSTSELFGGCSDDDSFAFSETSSVSSPLAHRPSSKTSFIPIASRSTPVKLNSICFPLTSSSPASFATPPSKQGSPVFVPQPRSRGLVSPSPANKYAPQLRTASKLPTPSKIPVSPTSNLSHSAKLPSSMQDNPFTSQTPLSQVRSDVNEAQTLPSSLSPPSPFMSPTIAAIQKFTTLIPMSWGPRSSSPTLPQHRADLPTSSIKNAKPAFVSKGKQLEKLRLRLTQERKLQSHIREGALRINCGSMLQL